MSTCRILLISADDVKNYTDVSKNVSDSKIAHWIPIAQDKHIKSAIGEVCYNNLLDGVDNDDLTALELTLLNGNDRQYAGIKAALAWWVLYYAYPNLHSTITPTGVQSKEPEDTISIDSSLLEMRRRDARDNAEYYEGQLICYIKDNVDDYPCYNETGSCCTKKESDSYNGSGIILD